MKKAFIFPGQGSQFPGMGLELYKNSELARTLFEKGNQLLGFRITDIMFDGTEDELKKTNVTQPAIFLNSFILSSVFADRFQPDMVAGHSLGEFSALAATASLCLSDALILVRKRAEAMQQACERTPSTMAAVLSLDFKKVEEICKSVDDEIVSVANYNSPGQVVISGTLAGVNKASELVKQAGAKRVIFLPVGGAFHSVLMEPAQIELSKVINILPFHYPVCPVYQNVTGMPEKEPEKIKKNLITQLTAPVLWSQSIQQMFNDGATIFYETGPGKVLQNLVKKIVPAAEAKSIEFA